jgi:hypothetical protein
MQWLVPPELYGADLHHSPISRVNQLPKFQCIGLRTVCPSEPSWSERRATTACCCNWQLQLEVACPWRDRRPQYRPTDEQI